MTSPRDDKGEPVTVPQGTSTFQVKAQEARSAKKLKSCGQRDRSRKEGDCEGQGRGKFHGQGNDLIAKHCRKVP